MDNLHPLFRGIVESHFPGLARQVAHCGKCRYVSICAPETGCIYDARERDCRADAEYDKRWAKTEADEKERGD
jgi:hypothetical protein